VCEPRIDVRGATVTEGSGGGTTALVFVVSLSQPAGAQGASVRYATRPGTATAGTDFFATSGVLRFGPGERSKTVTVQVVRDDTIEADEHFSLDLSDPVDAYLGSASATGTIKNDDHTRGDHDGDGDEDDDDEHHDNRGCGAWVRFHHHAGRDRRTVRIHLDDRAPTGDVRIEYRIRRDDGSYAGGSRTVTVRAGDRDVSFVLDLSDGTRAGAYVLELTERAGVHVGRVVADPAG
jgi:hypothetical protein